MSKSTKKSRFGFVKNINADDVKDVLNRVWVLLVLTLLWSAAYALWFYSTVPFGVKRYQTAGLVILGFMHLFVNISKKPDVVE